MMQTIQANKISLKYLRDKFNLQRATDEQFFTEWLIDTPEISDREKQTLDEVKRNYLHLTENYPMVESIVKMVVLSPILNLAGFFQPPFEVSGEKSVEVFVEGEDEVIKGDIDVLVVQNQLWVIVIESKRSILSLELAIPQALAYMLSNPNHEKPSFGLVMNGSHFIFLKLLKQDIPKYAMSDEFSLLKRGNDLYRVVSILKRFGQLIMQ